MMSQQKFTVYERFAFLEAYKKCIYCAKPIIDISDLQIDHLLPQSLARNKTAWEKTLLEYELPKNYEVNAYYNLVASCLRCNSIKSAKTKRIINSIYLNIAEDKAIKIQKEVSKIKRKIIAQRQEQNVTIPFGFLFREKTAKGPRSKSKLVDLYDEAVYMGGLNEFCLDGFEDKIIQNGMPINTVAEYERALSEGWYPATSFSIKISGYFEKARCFLHALNRAKLPQISYFSDDNIGLKSFSRLSGILAKPSWVPPSDIGFQFRNNISLAKFFKEIDANIITTNEDILHFEWQGLGFYYEELLRADFSGNGYEEILCSSYEYAIGGTLGVPEIILLQITSPNALISCISFDNLMKCN